MTDSEILEYLLSHAPLERFYIFISPDNGGELMKYFDGSGKSWSIMEDDDEVAACAIEFLKRSSVKSFDDYSRLLQFEQEFARTRGGSIAGA
ncbi:hypothetical protein [Burkholderia stagnalis]|uniref:hypothetical protein n=1 Tax=Burkholderia stagnalis TaxID=1503054 RepID=UPI000F5F368B|nr:hypothetical protein [Burkholderia stagnalis]